MRTALASRTRQPACGLTIEDHTVHLSAYQTPGYSNMIQDCCLASDGSIIRVLLASSPFGFTSNFAYTRVTDPAQANQWAALTVFSGASGNMFFASGCCCVSNNGGTLRAFAQQGTGGNALWCWTSTDNGNSWSGPVTVVSPPGTALVKGIASAGHNDVFFLYDVLGGEKMGLCTISGGTWSGITNWTLFDPINAAGLGVVWTGSQYNLVYSDNYTLYSASYDGITWTAGAILASTTNQSVGHVSPRLTVFAGLYHLVNAEIDSGTLTGSTYNYCRVRESADFVHWSDGWIIPEVAGGYGGNYFFLAAPATGSSGARYYFCTPGAVLSTPAFNISHSSQYLDVSTALLSYRRVEKVNAAAELEVILDNKGGQYNDALNLSGGTDYQPITPGALLKLSEGYRVSGTPDTQLTGVYRVMQISVLRGPTQNQLRITGLDLSERLDRVTRWQNVFSNQTIQWLLLEICARAGLFAVNIVGGSQLTQIVPLFVIQANQKYRKALNALCTTYGLNYFLDQSETLQIRELQASDASVWSYQDEIETVAFGANYDRANHVVASGKPPAGSGPLALSNAESYDATANAAMRVERLLNHVDFKSTTSAQAQIAADLVLYAEQRAQMITSLVVPLNPALQLADVITVTDAPAPVGSGQSIVGYIVEHQALYDAQQATCESQLHVQLKSP